MPDSSAAASSSEDYRFKSEISSKNNNFDLKAAYDSNKEMISSHRPMFNLDLSKI